MLIINIIQLAEHILAVVHRAGQQLTNLELQKILFFTIGMSIRNNPDEEIDFFGQIYDCDFEKWRYGPVVPSLYFRYNIYGNRPIESNGNYNEVYERFDNLILNLSNVDVYRLVALSHEMDAWQSYEPDILDGNYVAPYTFQEIVRDFRNA